MTKEQIERFEQAENIAKQAKHTADTLVLATPNGGSAGIAASRPRAREDQLRDLLPLYMKCVNTSAAPYPYEAYLDAGFTQKFKTDQVSGSDSATAPATKGLGRYKMTSATLAQPEVVEIFEDSASASPKTLEELIDDSTDYKTVPLTFVLDNKIMELTVLVKKSLTEETTDVKQTFTVPPGTDMRRLVLQVQEDTDTSEASANGKLRVDYVYLKSGS